MEARAPRPLLLLFCTAGIYGAYLTQGLVSEHLQIKRFGEQQERFAHMEALNGAQALMCFLWAYALLLLGQRQAPDGSGKGARGAAAWHAYWKPALSNAVGPAFGMIALKNISYPAQVLAKSIKMVPVMVMGTLLHRKRYSPFDYMCMSLVGGGVGLFARRSSSKVTTKLAAPNAPLGYSLCFLNLALDGYTNAFQDELLREHPNTPPTHMMAWMNFWCALYYGAYLAVSGVGAQLAAFCARHPAAAGDVALFCLCGAVGQLFIFLTIKTFGSLVNTLICTTRKFFTILVSVVLLGNPLLPAQWLAVALVFSGLIAHSLAKGGGGGHGGGGKQRQQQEQQRRQQQRAAAAAEKGGKVQ